MVVDSVSPTPFALLRRAKHFEYRDDDRTLQQFSDFEDPVEALTEECRRVLKGISTANQSTISTTKASTSLGDASWSRFEDIGFGGIGDYEDDDEPDSALGRKRKTMQGMNSAPQTRNHDLGRPTTPSWADFLSSGFVEESTSPTRAPLFLPSDKILPPIDLDRRAKSSQLHKGNLDELEPGELASINAIDLDDAFWWVWITSLAGEETTERKAVFGRCALIETTIDGGTWLVIEEMVKGAAPEPEVGAYIAEKKSRFTFGKRSKMSRTKSMARKTPVPKNDPLQRRNQVSPSSKTSIGPDQHARIQAAAAALQQKQKQQETDQRVKMSPRRARQGDAVSTKTTSVFTLQPVLMSEAGAAMKWANSYDKQAVRAAYLGNNFAGRGSGTELPTPGGQNRGTDGTSTPQPPRSEAPKPDRGFPKHQELPRNDSGIATDRGLPPLPAATPSETAMQAAAGPPPPVPAPPAPLPTAPQMPSIAPPPAPLPVDPKAQPANALAEDAAEIPLPAATPMEPSAKALTVVQGEELKPTRIVTNSQPNGLTTTWSPESRTDPKKLKKQQGSGFKGFFGTRKGPVLPSTPQPADSTAVAAARAAYVGPQMRPNYNASGSSNSLSRRLSTIGRRKTPPVTSPATPTIPDSDEPLPPPPAPFKDEFTSQASLSHVDSNEQRHANYDLRKFDQGPLEQPAFMPADEAHGSPRPSFTPEESDGPSRLSTPEFGARYEPPLRHGEYEPSVSSEGRSVSLVAEESPAINRWAEIRKHAAERMSEVQRVNQDKTEDGDDSGEESECSL